jgi:hypothetical protein
MSALLLKKAPYHRVCKRSSLTDPENLHGVQGIVQSKKSRHGNQCQGGHTRAELECQKVLNVVENGFA